MKVFLFNDSTSQNNWGCRATTLGLIKLIEEGGHEIVGSMQLEKISTIKTNNVTSVLKKILKKNKYLFKLIRSLAWNVKKMGGYRLGFISSFKDFDGFSKMILSQRIWKQELPQMQVADLILVNGEGSIYGNEQKGFFTLFVCWFAKIKLNKRCALVNHTLDLSNPNMESIAKIVYPMLDDISFREKISEDKYKKICNIDKNLFVPDAAFVHKVNTHESLRTFQNNNKEKLLGLNIIEDNYICILGSSILGRPEKSNLFPIDQFLFLVEKLLQQKYKVIMVASDTTDESPFKKIAILKNLPFFGASTDLKSGIAILTNAICLIGGRWHPSILASLGGTPSIMMSANTSKTKAFLNMFDLPDKIYDPFSLDQSSDSIISLLLNYQQISDLRSKIKNKAIRYSELAKYNIRSLNSDLNNEHLYK
tara:strand:+ start:2036 stop:3301 length:1266 start_codon:yes stop_codon:yes gene_type:complete